MKSAACGNRAPAESAYRSDPSHPTFAATNRLPAKNPPAYGGMRLPALQSRAAISDLNRRRKIFELYVSCVTSMPRCRPLYSPRIGHHPIIAREQGRCGRQCRCAGSSKRRHSASAGIFRSMTGRCPYCRRRLEGRSRYGSRKPRSRLLLEGRGHWPSVHASLQQRRGRPIDPNPVAKLMARSLPARARR